MPPFPRPRFDYSYELGAQRRRLRRWRDREPGRAIPAKRPDRVLLATWNVANLGAQHRGDDDYALLAEIMGWFDVVALQEVNDDLSGLRAILSHLPARYRVLCSDASGNRERLAFLYDARKLVAAEEIGEVAPPPSDYRRITLDGIEGAFAGFDRTPYLVTLEAGALRMSLVNVHLFFGSERKIDVHRRCLETFAVARWADQRRRSRTAATRDVIALGDFNLPKIEPGDAVYRALTAKGLTLPKHQTQIGTAIASDSRYDQIAFFPGETSELTEHSGVFDFDGALFPDLWESRGRKDFHAYMRYHLSDHRPMWVEMRTG